MAAQAQTRSTSLLQAAWILVPLLLIGCAAYLTFLSQNALMDTVAALDRGSELQTRIRQVYISLIDAETGQRGFLLTSREAYLVPYGLAAERLPRQLDQLASMTANDPEQQKNLIQLRALVADKLGELGLTIRYAKAGDMAAALKLVNSDQGKVDMDKIRLVVRQMRINADGARAASEDVYLHASREDTRHALFLVAVNGVFFVIAAVLLWRIRKMESLVTICAWSHTIEYEGRWMSFEEYLRVRFGLESTHGISPAEAARFKHSMDPVEKERR